MKKNYLVIIVVFTVLYTLSFTAAIPILNEKSIKFTEEEEKFIKELNKRGELKIGSTYQENTYFVDKNGNISGFHYKMAKEFAKMTGVKLNIKIIEDWSSYFSKKGENIEKVKTDSAYSYTPDLFGEVELYVAGITALPWREKLFDIVKFIPNKQVIICRKDEKVSSIKELNNKSIVFVKNSSFEGNFMKILKEKKLNTQIIYVDDFRESPKMVAESKHIFTIDDCDNAFKFISEYPILTIAFPISDFEMIGWGVSKNNKIFSSILTKYFKYAKEKGIMDKYWKEELGVTFSEYMKVLEYK